ncbi:hypothetical protein Pmgp_00924 [Pelotomaculum propionicicum]|uniref:Uncharacterized protein n=1 Tax=Pelotomaculum propionicicum TaxID=258475 RepID=A0A4Y7RUQ0_9FIRM|nr:hypothetical protein Pmgp_00924 [Pelotomaculum propionicicum]
MLVFGIPILPLFGPFFLILTIFGIRVALAAPGFPFIWLN